MDVLLEALRQAQQRISKLEYENKQLTREVADLQYDRDMDSLDDIQTNIDATLAKLGNIEELQRIKDALNN